MDAADHPELSDGQLFERTLLEATASLGLSLDEDQRTVMCAHFVAVVAANRQFNLTRITGPAEAAVKHYADSLSLLASPWVEATQSLTVLDVGTGAGFPAVPLAAVCAKWRVLAIDGTGKKVRFVESTALELGLSNLAVRHARAADLAREKGTGFDLVLARAVGKLGPVLREVRPLVRAGGSVVFYKTARLADDEREEGDRVAAQFGWIKGESFDVRLTIGDEILERRLVRFRCS